jgi:hypothetical protein
MAGVKEAITWSVRESASPRLNEGVLKQFYWIMSKIERHNEYKLNGNTKLWAHSFNGVIEEWSSWPWAQYLCSEEWNRKWDLSKENQDLYQDQKQLRQFQSNLNECFLLWLHNSLPRYKITNQLILLFSQENKSLLHNHSK